MDRWVADKQVTADMFSICLGSEYVARALVHWWHPPPFVAHERHS